MEGVLLKWTNYLSGWQQRYFILDDGVLSYYRSKEEMNSGCKGSVKLSVCDVIVHSSDPRKFDLILGEQRYYLRALSQSDRQRWIVALGSSKVGTTLLKAEDVNIYEPSQTQLIDNHRSELRLYHNLMVQQVKDIQSQLKEGTIPDMTRIDELTSMLNASCSTFLIALDELMILSNAQAPWLSSIVARTNLETSPATFRNIILILLNYIHQIWVIMYIHH
uniref:SJCHGC04408 protein n=1 Tax=Schistosoma japonicum TaxID=6182 RepID=Q5D8E7_SCHJA|nr:SJCHGC04408 protein [Schistosoma japonicum]